jgi:hypothetical protein
LNPALAKSVRLDELESGKVIGIPAEQVFKMARAGSRSASIQTQPAITRSSWSP